MFVRSVFPALWRAVVALAFAAPLQAAEDKIDFARDIQPIFVKRCYECHGPDKQKSGLRLDNKSDALRGGKSGKPVIAPGKSSESELLRRITTEDADDAMPPKGDRLDAQQIAALRTWMDQGANWPERDIKKHWAYLKPTHPALPSIHSKLLKNEIDYFVLARLQKEGLSMSPEADRRTLIRRLSLDLIGLPPTPAEVEAFVKDRSSNAYEKLVDRLLESPHYGEHIARWWLDVARYADSNGYQVDMARSIWPYRDWVINAFNRNMRFDQFTIEQLAGDLLPNASLEQKIATGFNRNTKINDEGGGDAEEYRTKAVKDRVATTSTAWLGLTMMCAECHTHKYDPITHEDYYKFYGFFNNSTDAGNYSVEPTLPVPAPDVREKVDYVRGEIRRTQMELASAEARLAQDQADWEKRIGNRTNVWKTLTLTNGLSVGGATLTNLDDGSVLSTGVNPIYDTITFDAETDLKGITAVLLETLPDPSLPHNGPGRWGKTGNFILDEFNMFSGVTNLVFAKATADWEQLYYKAEHAIDRNPRSGWAIGPQFGKRHFLIAELKEPLTTADGKVSFRFENYHGNSHAIGRYRLSVTTEKDAEALWPIEPEIAAILATTDRTEEQRARLTAYYRTASPTIRNLERQLFRLNEREAELAGSKFSTLVMQERPDRRETYIHVRGNFLDHGKTVTPGVPAFLPQPATNEPPNRLTLARWIVNPENPLPARVTVNRLWQRFFGTGLVKTSEDFGIQGEAPSHPELLDWLATEFIARGWDLKSIQKTMVMSATYRQAAATTDEVLQKDLYNRLLSHGPRFRMDSEMIRDQALAVSGLLNEEVGGPSVYPVQPAFLWKEIGFLRPEVGMDEWPLSQGPDLYRRGIYTFWRRVCTYPMFATFDAPSREVCNARRPRTNTPLQALAGLNESTLMEAARVFAQRILAHPGNDAQKLDFAFQLCEARPPTRFERARLLDFVRLQNDTFKSDRAAAEKLVAVGTAPRPQNLDAVPLAAWTMTANVLLNLDETLTKE